MKIEVKQEKIKLKETIQKTLASLQSQKLCEAIELWANFNNALIDLVCNKEKLSQVIILLVNLLAKTVPGVRKVTLNIHKVKSIG